MQYTLDSVVQVENALKADFPHNDIYRKSLIISGNDLGLLTENPQVLYFGILSVPPGVKALITYRGDEVMTVEPGSQIIEVFSEVTYVDLNELPVAAKGLFRGFSIQVQS